MRKISQNSQASNDKIAQLQNQVNAHTRAHKCIVWMGGKKGQCIDLRGPFWSLSVWTCSWKKPMTSCAQSRTRQRGCGRATQRWRSRWASWRAWTETCRRGAVQQTGRRPSCRRSCCFFRAPWTQRGGTTAKAPRRSGNCKVTPKRWHHQRDYITLRRSSPALLCDWCQIAKQWHFYKFYCGGKPVWRRDLFSHFYKVKCKKGKKVVSSRKLQSLCHKQHDHDCLYLPSYSQRGWPDCRRTTKA